MTGGIVINRHALVWRKSPFSIEGDCVELAEHGDRTLIRNSNDPNGPILDFTSSEWAAFVMWVRTGEGPPVG
jgi:hypothetical protein